MQDTVHIEENVVLRSAVGERNLVVSEHGVRDVVGSEHACDRDLPRFEKGLGRLVGELAVADVAVVGEVHRLA